MCYTFDAVVICLSCCSHFGCMLLFSLYVVYDMQHAPKCFLSLIKSRSNRVCSKANACMRTVSPELLPLTLIKYHRAHRCGIFSCL